MENEEDTAFSAESISTEVTAGDEVQNVAQDATDATLEVSIIAAEEAQAEATVEEFV